MSMDCDMDQDSDTTNSFHSTQPNGMNINGNSKPMNNYFDSNKNNSPISKPMEPILYSDSMDLDNDSSTKPRTLFSLLIDKRNQSKRNRKRSRMNKDNKNNNIIKSNNYEDIQDKLTKEELRVIKDLKEISDSKWCARGTIVTIHLQQRLHHFTCSICPAEGPYRDGEFLFDIFISHNYPFEAPLIRASHPIFHPNICMNTLEIGLPILSSDWNPVLSLNDVLFALQLIFQEPNIDEIIDNDISEYGFGVNRNHKPYYLSNINYNGSISKSICKSTSKSISKCIQNMESAILFRDEPQKFWKICREIIRGGINMFGINWQCIERKKRRKKQKIINGEKYDPNIGTQSFRLKDGDTTITKKSSVLRKRRRNEINHINHINDTNNYDILRCFASTTGSLKDGVHSDSSESQSSLINGLDNIEIQPPQKKRKIDKIGITKHDLIKINFIQHNNNNNNNNRDDDDFNMNI